jgi:hypothetical protein
VIVAIVTCVLPTLVGIGGFLLSLVWITERRSGARNYEAFTDWDEETPQWLKVIESSFDRLAADEARNIKRSMKYYSLGTAFVGIGSTGLLVFFISRINQPGLLTINSYILLVPSIFMFLISLQCFNLLHLLVSNFQK